ncbi:asmA family protein [Sphingomonas sp. Leaf17]|nr:asmA family protein [Sphingomonas sp. Leaf17]
MLLLAMFPWGFLKGRVEAALSKEIGRPVTIADIDRVDTIGFTPTIAVRGVRVPQADWAGTGDFATLREARVTFSVWPLLTGSFRPRDVTLDGLRLVLVRDRDKRVNWGLPDKQDRSPGDGPDLAGLSVRDSVIVYRDAAQGRDATVAFAADPVHGVRATGTGHVREAAVRIGLRGPSVAQAHGRPWPFTAVIDGDALSMTAKGTMDRPLDTSAMTLDVTARANDLKLIDAVIEAGLFRTQPVSLSAHVTHADDVWTATAMRATIGRSDLTGSVKVAKADGRTKVTARVAFGQLDFADLSSDEAMAEGRAKEARIGPRLVPDTRIDISKIKRTDATMDFTVGRIVSRDGPSPIRAVRGHAVLDNRRLTISPLTMALKQGTITGSVRIDQRSGAANPMLTVALRLRDGSVTAMGGGGGDFTGNVDASARLTGRGETIRAAIGRSTGTLGFVARDGMLPARIAAALGFDAGRALLTDSEDHAGLRCVIVGVTMRGGRGRVDPFVIDTTQSQLRGTGQVVFPDERIAVTLTGAPKRDSVLRLPGSATLSGTLQQPNLVIPPVVKSVGNIFKAIGRAITGKQGPTASDANCGALAGRVLG